MLFFSTDPTVHSIMLRVQVHLTIYQYFQYWHNNSFIFLPIFFFFEYFKNVPFPKWIQINRQDEWIWIQTFASIHSNTLFVNWRQFRFLLWVSLVGGTCPHGSHEKEKTKFFRVLWNIPVWQTVKNAQKFRNIEYGDFSYLPSDKDRVCAGVQTTWGFWILKWHSKPAMSM